MATEADLREENRILRERVSQLEAGRSVDPVLRALLDHAPGFLAVITPEGRFVATGRTSEAFGSVVGRSVFEFSEADQHAVMREAYTHACATKQPVTYESIAYGENGEPGHTYLVRVVPLIEAGSVNALLLVPADITERVRLERSLSLSEQKLRLAVQATGMGLWSWDIVRDEVLWDRRALEIFGAGEPPRDYEKFLALIHPDDRPRLHEVVGRAVETGVYTPVEHRLARPAEIPERWVLGTGAITRDESGKPTMMMGGVLDITAQKHAAAQVSRAQRVEALGQLSAGLAHNFNNVLGTIIPNLELALENAVADSAASISAALGASMQARDLVKRLLAITAPRSAEAAKVCDPRAVVERAVTLCRASFPREIQIDVIVAPGVGHAAMTATDLDQVVLNLLFNARDALEAMTGRPRTIAVHVDAPGSPEGPCVRVRVHDNGVGMSEQVVGRVFEPFFTTKPAHRGAGLGLADVLLRVRDAGGQIDVESALGDGTTFTLVLPSASAPSASVAPVAAAPALAEGQTILIVDDEPALRAVVRRLLSRAGYGVLEANNAEEARALLKTKPREIKLVLLDQSMPHESGPEALPSLKRLSNAPIVLFTGGISDLPPGAAAILEKPAQASELLRVVGDLVGRDR
jgi:nitrogen-specific signal transduction histidine kinase/PAS domain-containing protein/CheY-like chemotaxis protein